MNHLHYASQYFQPLDDHTFVAEERGVKLFLIQGAEGGLLIDTGFGGLDLSGLAAAPGLRVVNTHCHADHTGGNHYFPTVFCHLQEQRLIRERDGSRGAPTYRQIPISDGFRFSLGGVEVDCCWLPGHSPGNIGLLDRSNAVLYSGDIILTTPVYLYQDEQSLPAYISSLERLLAMRDSISRIVPSHGGAEVGFPLVEELLRLARAVEAGRSRGEAAQTPEGAACVLHRQGRASLYYHC